MSKAPFWATLAIYAVLAAASDFPRFLARRQSLANLLYSPYCKFDDDVVHDNDKLIEKIHESDFVFSGKVISDVELHQSNKSISFTVFVKRIFKSSAPLKNTHKLKVLKKLYDGEGTRCRQVVRYRYIALFLGRKPEGRQDVDVILSVSPITVTLQNLDRVNEAVKKGI